MGWIRTTKRASWGRGRVTFVAIEVWEPADFAGPNVHPTGCNAELYNNKRRVYGTEEEAEGNTEEVT